MCIFLVCLCYNKEKLRHSEFGENLFVNIFFSLVYTPCLNCFGDEVVNIMLKENQTQPDIPPASTSVSINIHIQAVNDPPSVFLTLNGSTLLSKDPTEEVIVSIYRHPIGLVL